MVEARLGERHRVHALAGLDINEIVHSCGIRSALPFRRNPLVCPSIRTPARVGLFDHADGNHGPACRSLRLRDAQVAGRLKVLSCAGTWPIRRRMRRCCPVRAARPSTAGFLAAERLPLRQGDHSAGPQRVGVERGAEAHGVRGFMLRVQTVPCPIIWAVQKLFGWLWSRLGGAKYSLSGMSLVCDGIRVRHGVLLLFAACGWPCFLCIPWQAFHAPAIVLVTRPPPLVGRHDVVRVVRAR